MDAWAMEKLAKVAEAIVQARDLYSHMGPPPEEGWDPLDPLVPSD